MAITFLTNEDEKRLVKSVNGQTPDENGNVEIEIPETVTDEQIAEAVAEYMAEHPVSGGNVDLPEVTAEDAGKFLRVSSDGAWVAESLTDVSEVGA